MAAKYIGAHMPTAGGLQNAIRNGNEIGCTAVQVFTSSPRQWKAKEITDQMVSDFYQAVKETGMGPLVSHDSYLINLSSPDAEHRGKSLNGLKNEMKRAGQYGIPFVVSHMGAANGQDEEDALKKVAESALEVLAETPEGVTLLMETTAGQGSALNYKFEHLARILELTKSPKRLAVCVDTCHIFVAGYDISTPESYEATFSLFDKLVGCEQIRAIHCNDSKKKLGSKVDRHENIGKGEIGLEAFRCLVNDKRFISTPIIVETPDADEMHAVNVKVLWDLVRG